MRHRRAFTSRLLLEVGKASLAVLIALILSPAVSGQTGTTASARSDAADNEYQTGAVVWTQSSAEARALRYQAFTLARLMLDRDLKTNHHSSRRRAVIADVDETVLDNSRYQAELILKHEPYSSASWTAWCERAEAGALPGAVEFLRYTASRRVRVFYVTNRRQAEKAATIANLKQLDLPDVNEQTIMVRIDGASKESRRQEISRQYRIVLLLGDNLADFSNVFEGKTTEERAAAVDAARKKFGTQFIILPNPMYGDWEAAIYGYASTLTEEEKATRRKSALKH